MNREEQLVNYFKDFSLTDLLGFANILGVQEKDDFVEFVTDIVEKYGQMGRRDRRELLKLAKDISKENKAK